ncbi:MAG: MBOAT family O-acyltransferase [Pseudomonadota bacterium]
MIFNTPLFYFFFVAFMAVYGLLLLRHRPRVLFIIVASLVFYGAWNWRFIPLLVGSAVADYFIAQAIGNATSQGRKKFLVTLSLTINLGILALFKYADFVLQSVQDFLLVFGVEASLPTLSWVLPVGISFYTFQSLSYTIDVYRGDMAPRRGLFEFVASVSFFPQLVAGPILRARQILPQMHAIPVPTWVDAKHGFLLITAGVIKKTIADLLAIPAEKAFDTTGSVSLLETWTGVLAFAGQIYGDFAGYTDMAIGIALLMGFKIPLNFRVPYFAVSPVDFWRRWHISLSSWLRDYLYISLGGNRNNRRWRNVMITMLLGGLWHGAAWTFVAWGFFHGLIIAGTHALANLRIFAGFGAEAGGWRRLVKWAITFYLVLIGWVFFRATSLGGAVDLLADMHLLNALPAAGHAATLIFGLTVAAVFLMHLMDFGVLRGATWLERKPWLFWALIFIGQSLCLWIGAPSDEFIYFQF